MVRLYCLYCVDMWAKVRKIENSDRLDNTKASMKKNDILVKYWPVKGEAVMAKVRATNKCFPDPFFPDDRD